MNCFECNREGTERPAVATCRCGAALCLPHLRQVANDVYAGSPHGQCSHDTWQPGRPAA